MAVASALAGGRFSLTASEVAALRSSAALPPGPAGDDALLLAVLRSPSLVRAAVVPVSSFPVGAAALGASGALHLGVNVEPPRGAGLGCALHAEQCCGLSARAASERRLVALGATHAPCGHCRQWLQELQPAPGSLRVLVAPQHGATHATGATLAALLPAAFGPGELLQPGSPDAPLRLLGNRHAGLQLDAAARRAVAALRAAAAPGGGDAEAADTAEASLAAIYAALAAANGCHAPYSRTPAGAALVLRPRAAAGEGGAAAAGWAVVAGGSAESAAFNPSVTPLQAALAAAVARGADVVGESPGRPAVAAGVLLQLAGGAVDHAPAASHLLLCAAPGATLVVLGLESNLTPRPADE